MKKNIAIVAGGYSSEFEVSLRSAENLYAFIDKEKYNAYIVVLKKDAWKAINNYELRITNYETGEIGEAGEAGTFLINKSDFSFRKGNNTVNFDFAYITIHGTPGEDGLLQGYFDMIGMPYSTCDVLTSALTFNKYMCNQFLKSQGICVSDSILIRKGHSVCPDQIVEKLGLPVFVKPNNSGSSFGVSKVKETAQIQVAVEKAFHESSEVLIERFISGNEFTCGCYQSKNEIIVFPVTEIIPKNDFFDYGAKYKGEVEEITPARISVELTEKIQRETEKIYQLIGAKGIIRIDYIVSLNKIPVLLEVNTTPGMTATSFIPQQVQAAGLSMQAVMTEIIEGTSYNPIGYGVLDTSR